MIKRTIEISQAPAHLSIANDQLLIWHKDDLAGRVPCEDIGAVVVDQLQTTYSHPVLARLGEAGAILVVCGRDHLPVAVLLPLVQHTEVVWRVQSQLAVGKPLAKQLWKQIVQGKILAQARNLTGKPRNKLTSLAQSVRSGDPTNVEAHAARVYWAHWLGEAVGFRRDTDGGGLNSLLNYGYAILRAAVARALISAGLLTSVGLKHANRGNAFALADDLMEPLRPLVDRRVRQLHCEGRSALNREAKASLLETLAEPVAFGGETGPLMVALHRYTGSLIRCFCGETKRLLLPTTNAPVASRHGSAAVADLESDPWN